MAKLKAPVMLVILDGFGMGDQSDTTNAVVQAKPHCFNQLWDMYPHTKLEASGLAVGLPEGQMGNSEVGHLNLGSGRIVYQDLTRITKDVESGEFYNRPVMQELYEVAKKQSLHLIGLVSDGNVHCSLEHIKAVIKGAHDHGIEHVYVHSLLDGRDVAPQCAQGYLKDLEAYMAELNCGKIATVSGRYYAMDRDNRWDRVELAYNAIYMVKEKRQVLLVKQCNSPMIKMQLMSLFFLQSLMPKGLSKMEMQLSSVTSVQTVVVSLQKPQCCLTLMGLNENNCPCIWRL